MIEQLPLFKPRQPTAKRQADLDRLNAIVREFSGIARKELAQRLSWSIRKVRAVASASDLVVSAPNSDGYHYLYAVPLGAYQRYRKSRLSQAEQMRAKVARTDCLYYARRSAGL